MCPEPLESTGEFELSFFLEMSDLIHHDELATLFFFSNAAQLKDRIYVLGSLHFLASSTVKIKQELCF